MTHLHRQEDDKTEEDDDDQVADIDEYGWFYVA